MSRTCRICREPIQPQQSVAAIDRHKRIAHITCWLEWRDSGRSLPPPLVMVVDDDDGGRYATRRMLERGGFSVVEAATAAQALAVMHTRPDLVLLDLRLPDADGVEVCREIKRNAAADRERVFAAGADGYLVKPLVASVITIINGLIELV